jgi:DNA-binding response OmpR family regulator/anti-sigma regulatory factor (Ser/Thr protein kinase)
MSVILGRILVVDDNARNLAILKKILGNAYRVSTAGDGEEALRTALRFVPDLVLLDISMPKMDGYEVCRRIRATLSLAHTKIIMVSAKIMVAERLAGYEAGADDYVVKPFDEEELLAKVRVYMRLKKVEEVDRLRSDLLMLLNQEARIPMAAILSPIETALGEPTLSSDGKRLLELAREGAHQLNEFVDRVLFLSRLHSGLVPLQFKREDLGALVRAVLEEMGPFAQQADVRLAAAAAEKVMVEVDAEQIGRVIACLLDNAIRLTPRGGVVQVGLEVRDGHACVSVSDQGPGVPAHFLGRLVEGLTLPEVTRQSPGRGLSLVIARAMARCHEGILSAENLETGGAIFTLQLPAAEDSGHVVAEGLRLGTTAADRRR